MDSFSRFKDDPYSILKERGEVMRVLLNVRKRIEVDRHNLFGLKPICGYGRVFRAHRMVVANREKSQVNVIAFPNHFHVVKKGPCHLHGILFCLRR